MTNRNPVKQVFITFPKSHIDKQEFRDFLLRFSPEYYKVAEEKHKDGTPHLHAVVKFKNKYSCRHVINEFKKIYPDHYKRFDIEPVRSIKSSINYLSKEDQSPLESSTYIEARNPRKSNQIALARELGYDTVSECVDDYKKTISDIEKLWSHAMDCERNYGQPDLSEDWSSYHFQKLKKEFLNREFEMFPKKCNTKR